MQSLYWIIATVLLYSGAIIWQWRSDHHPRRQHLFLLLIFGIAAVAFHGVLLHWQIDVPTGQNLSLFNLFSLVAWLVAGLVLITTITKPTENLIILIFPIAIIAIILAAAKPGYDVINTGANPKQLIHILLSTLAFSVICIAALQAVLLAIQDYLLRHIQTRRILQKLPPLEIMEQLLFQMILIGFLLLSAVLITSIIFFHPIFAPSLRQKSILSIMAWSIFAILLIGRYYIGWRGRTAIQWTLAGTLIMVSLYYCSQLLLR